MSHQLTCEEARPAGQLEYVAFGSEVCNEASRGLRVHVPAAPAIRRARDIGVVGRSKVVVGPLRREEARDLILGGVRHLTKSAPSSPSGAGARWHASIAAHAPF
jgi:hypothetical protein